MKIIFVCTGNTCRSFMAECALKKMIGERGLDWVVSSAGLMAFEGAPGNEDARRALEKAGVEFGAHRAKNLDERQISENDVIITMTVEQKKLLRQKFGTNKARTLAEAAGEDFDVEDPYGRPFRVYEECLSLIMESLEKYLESLGIDE